MATIQEILDKINASKSNNINNNSFIDLMRQISGNPEDAIAPVNDTNSIYGHIVQMYTTLYDSGVDYAILADDIEAIQGLYERLNAIDSLYADKTKLDSLYADKAKLDQLFADKAVIDRVYGSITNIDRVHTSIDKLDTVYSSVLKMDVIADNITEVNTVADNMTVLNEIYNNRVEIYAADNNATVATTKAIEASNSATIATTKASEASASALAASTASNTSTTKATESAASAVLANTSAGSASTSAASASSNAAIATTKASEASVSASNASTSAATASTKASAASVSASTSATKATEAATSASTTLGYKNDVSAMKLAIETIYDTFDDRFLGTKTVDPTLDNDGNTLIDGALYFDTTTNAMKVYDVGTTTWYAMPQIYLNSLLDVELTSLTTGNILVWNGTKWVNVLLTKASIGLANVDNTSDTSKPVSTAQKTELNLKANLASPTFTGTVSGVTKAMVGLGSVDNTSDATKNVLSATKLATARTIALSGDVSGSTSFDGSGNVTLVAAVANDSHVHSTTTITGLGTAATRNVGTGNGNVMDSQDVRIFGGANSGISNPDSITSNTITYSTGTTATGIYHDGAIYAQYYAVGSYGHQIFGDYRSGGLAVRGLDNGVWTPWRQVYHTGNMPATATRWPTFDEVTGKPATFTPESHNHTSLSGTVYFSGSTGNDYNNSNIMVNGNGAANTIKPSIGFHQPGVYAGTLQQVSASEFSFFSLSEYYATLKNNINMQNAINVNGTVGASVLTNSVIVESGSNTNGYYTKFANGSMMEYKYINCAATANVRYAEYITWPVTGLSNGTGCCLVGVRDTYSYTVSQPPAFNSAIFYFVTDVTQTYDFVLTKYTP